MLPAAAMPAARSWIEPMYLPESHKQMFEILSDLRIYAAMNDMPHLAEKLDDALIMLLSEGRDPSLARRPGLVTQDTL